MLELIAKRGRALVEARSLVILLREGADLVVAASAGVTERAIGARVPIDGSTTGQVLSRATCAGSPTSARTCGSRPPQLGVMQAADRRCSRRSSTAAAGSACSPPSTAAPSAEHFSEDDEMTLRAFAASGATAVALAQTVQHERLRHSLRRGRGRAPALGARAARRDAAGPRRPARHPRRSALRRVEQDDVAELLRESVGQVEREIENLRAIITELRPAALDELGLDPRDRGARRPRQHGRGAGRSSAALDVPGDGRRVGAGARDDGLPARPGGADERRQARRRPRTCGSPSRDRRAPRASRSPTTARGFDAGAATSGFGLAGMRERVQLAAVELSVTPTGERHDGPRACSRCSELDEPVIERVADQIGA